MISATSSSLFPCCCLILIVFLSISLGATSQEADPSLFCPNSTDNIYDRNTSSGATYHSNLNLLLSSFSNLSRTNSFYNSTVPLNTSSSISNPAYGLFMCRGDVDLDTCERCITAAAGRLLANCSNTKRANIWYQFCILRYSDQSIFSILDRGLAIYVFSLANVTDGDRFTQVSGGAAVSFKFIFMFCSFCNQISFSRFSKIFCNTFFL